MYVEGLKRIIEIDKRNMRIFEEFYSKTSISTTQEDTIDPAIIGFLAEIVPIFAESKSCIVAFKCPFKKLQIFESILYH